MHYRLTKNMAICAALILGLAGAALSQGGGTQSDLSALQRLDVMRSKLDAMRRSINSAVSSMPAAKSTDEKKNLDDPRERLRGMDKEVGSLNSEVNDIRAKQERSDRYDPTTLDRLEASIAELNTRVQSTLQASASTRTEVATSAAVPVKKKKGKFFGLLGGGGDDEYAELTSTVAPGRDRVLFTEASRQVRKGNHETGRLLFSTIINTYPDSPFLPLAKLAIADSFYLEGTTAALVQAAQGYLDWLTFFPTDPLADDAMLKVAESEMRQMGLSDRDVTHARKAEQRLKALLQQYPQTNLRPVVEDRLRESQEVLAMHSYQVGNFYLGPRFQQGKGGLKGAQSRFKEVVDKYPNFSERDGVLFKLAYTYQQEEEPDEAAKYYQELLRNFPNSEFAEKAKDQLGIIGVPIPEPDPARRNLAPAAHPSFVGNLMQQVSGKPEITVNTDGILISKDKKEGTGDLIDEAIKYNGQLPANVTPVAPVQRTTRQAPSPTPRPAQSVIQPPPGSPATPAPREIKP